MPEVTSFYTLFEDLFIPKGGKLQAGGIMMEEAHKPVLLKEIIEYLAPEPSGWYLDATVGDGGHATEISKYLTDGGILVGLDRDMEALEKARQSLSPYKGRFQLVKGCFGLVNETLQEAGLFKEYNGILLDIGVSSRHLDRPDRGFSYRFEGPLDMRMDTDDTDLRAEDVVNDFPRNELVRIFRLYGEEKWASRIATFIEKYRESERITTTTQLAGIIKNAVPAAARGEKIHPARRCFQALRIFVNSELEQLKDALPQCAALLKVGGRFAVISYHSLEDRIVKKFIKENSGHCTCPPGFPVCRCQDNVDGIILKSVTRRPVYPSDIEVRDNPRSRSARLRIGERIR